MKPGRTEYQQAICRGDLPAPDVREPQAACCVPNACASTCGLLSRAVATLRELAAHDGISLSESFEKYAKHYSPADAPCGLTPGELVALKERINQTSLARLIDS